MNSTSYILFLHPKVRFHFFRMCVIALRAGTQCLTNFCCAIHVYRNVENVNRFGVAPFIFIASLFFPLYYVLPYSWCLCLCVQRNGDSDWLRKFFQFHTNSAGMSE